MSNTVIIEPLPKDLPLKLQTCLEAETLENASVIPTENEMTEVLNIHDEEISDFESDRKRHVSRESDDIEVLASNLQGFQNDVDIKMLSSEDLSDCEFYENTAHNSSANDADDSLQLESDDGKLF